MTKPSFLFDGRLLLQQEKIEEIGFSYFCLGKG